MTSGLCSSRTSQSSSGRPAAWLTSAGGVGAGDDERQRGRRVRAASGSRPTVSSRPGALRAAPKRRRRPPLSGSSGAPSPSRNAASGSATLAARSPSGVEPSPSIRRIAPRRRSGERAGEAGEHVGGVTPSPDEQLAEQARAGEPARDVVVQVGEQAAVAGVQLGRGAEAEHRGVERVEPEPRARRRRAGRRRPAPRASAASDERLVVGDVEAAERVAGVRVAGRGALDCGCGRGRRGRRSRPRRRASAEELTRGLVRGDLERLTGVRDDERAAHRRPELLVRVRDLVRDQLLARRRVRLVLAGREEDVAAGGERARRRPPGSATRPSCRCGRGRRRPSAPSALPNCWDSAGGERRAAAAGGGDGGLHHGMGDAARQDALAVAHARDEGAHVAVAHARRHVHRRRLLRRRDRPVVRWGAASSSASRWESRLLTAARA